MGRGLCSTLLLIQAQLYLEVKCALQAVSLSCTFEGSVVHWKWSTRAIQLLIGTADWGTGQPLFSLFGERDALLSPLLPHPQRGVADVERLRWHEVAEEPATGAGWIQHRRPNPELAPGWKVPAHWHPASSVWASLRFHQPFRLSTPFSRYSGWVIPFLPHLHSPCQPSGAWERGQKVIL